MVRLRFQVPTEVRKSTGFSVATGGCPQLAILVAVMVFLLPEPGAAEDGGLGFDPDRLTPLEWREVGPYRGGRCAAVTGVVGQERVYYFGAAGGGVWKTTDGGVSWRNVSDGFFGGSIGSVAVAESDPNVVYVGGGEKTVRGNVSHGDGVWKSTDAGRTWKPIGLSDSRHVCRIRVHPQDPDRVFAACLGHLFGPNDERGVYRSRDGGKSWERSLFANPHAGAVDLVMDPTNPRILYASLWRVRRTPWTLESGGEGSGLWKTTDGGDHWEELTRNRGLPAGPVGISGIAVSPTNSDNLYAMVESEEGGVFRSRDAGKTWTKTNQDRTLRQRAWYYTRIYADPRDEESVYVLNVRFYHSKDGGKTFASISTPHSDNHDLWIDPANPLRMIEGNDGGANVSSDGGQNWSPQDNQPTAQMYRVSTDNDFPYRLLGGQQDNSALRIRCRSLGRGGAIGIRDWEPTAGGESGHIVAKPDDPDVVFGGSYGGYLSMVNHRSGERRSVNVWPDNPMGWGAAELKYRFQWNFPIFFSPHNPGRLYAAGNMLFRSDDLGASWEAVSPDLTRDDKEKQGPSGGPITKDNTSVEYYCTIFAADESPHEQGVLWTGSDDGLIHLSLDDGQRWRNVTPPDLPEWTQINSLEIHPTEKGGLYVAATAYKLDDFTPYLYKTTDYGRSWKKITRGIPTDHFTRVVRADPDRAGLLYAGTERGVYVSFDDGNWWRPLMMNLPIVPITDLAVKDKNLIAATQGRGFWILDGLTILHQWRREITDVAAHLFSPRSTHRVAARRRESPVNRGTNPPVGVVIHYYLGEELPPAESLRLDLLTEEGEVIKSFTRKPAEGQGDEADERDRWREENLRQLDAKAGLQRFVWDFRYPNAEGFPGMILWSGGLEGPRALPGRYRARLTVGNWSATQPFEILPDPRSTATAEDLAEQFRFLIEVRDKLTETHRELRRLRGVRDQLAALDKRSSDLADVSEVLELAEQIATEARAVEDALYQTKNKSSQDPLNYPIRLNDKLAGLLSQSGAGDFAPTQQAFMVKRALISAIDSELARWYRIQSENIPLLNEKIRESGISLIVLPRDPEDSAPREVF